MVSCATKPSSNMSNQSSTPCEVADLEYQTKRHPQACLTTLCGVAQPGNNPCTDIGGTTMTIAVLEITWSRQHRSISCRGRRDSCHDRITNIPRSTAHVRHNARIPSSTTSYTDIGRRSQFWDHAESKYVESEVFAPLSLPTTNIKPKAIHWAHFSHVLA